MYVWGEKGYYLLHVLCVQNDTTRVPLSPLTHAYIHTLQRSIEPSDLVHRWKIKAAWKKAINTSSAISYSRVQTVLFKK